MTSASDPTTASTPTAISPTSPSTTSENPTATNPTATNPTATNPTATSTTSTDPGSTPETTETGVTTRFTMWSVFRAARPLPDDRAPLVAEAEELFDQLAGKDVVTRGTYDVSGLRADADVMVWWHASTVDALQEAYGRFRRTSLGRDLEPRWSSVGVHREAEFNKGHIPNFMAGGGPKAYISVYPFVRSYEWYLLPEDERRRMLAEHGRAARDYQDVRANTVASFSLGDYEWLLAFEADEMHRIVDLMRHLRAVDARRHVREEIPFFAGTRKPIAEIVAALP